MISMEKPSLSVVVLTYNEEIHLRRCLSSVRDIAREIVVVDSFSTDATVRIAGESGARVLQHEFSNQAQQFNWALDAANLSSDWILRLDADEYLTDELRDEIAERLSAVPASVAGFSMKRRVYFLGRWIRHGGYYPSIMVRLFRRGKGRSDMREMDEHIVVDGAIERLKEDFIDENLKGLEDWIAKHNRYATREAQASLRSVSAQYVSGDEETGRRVARRKIFLALPPFFRSFCYFIYRYFFRLGFLDGKEGLIFHFLQGFWYRFLVDAKLFAASKK